MPLGSLQAWIWYLRKVLNNGSSARCMLQCGRLLSRDPFCTGFPSSRFSCSHGGFHLLEIISPWLRQPSYSNSPKLGTFRCDRPAPPARSSMPPRSPSDPSFRGPAPYLEEQHSGRALHLPHPAFSGSESACDSLRSTTGVPPAPRKSATQSLARIPPAAANLLILVYYWDSR